MARLGFSSAALGSDRNALILRLGSRTGFGRSAGTSLRLTTALDTRWERGGIRNFQLSTSASFYKRQSDHRLFFASVKATFGHNLDADQQLLLGGDNGLRGYPLRYQFGDKRALVTLEQRFYSDWYPFRLFRVGGAVFFDIGRAWGSAKGAEAKNEILRDVGFGLRIGNTRSGLGRMTHIDFAFPLDGGKNIRDMQFLIQTKKSF
jgi:hemolysin activation/secretion protein